MVSGAVVVGLVIGQSLGMAILVCLWWEYQRIIWGVLLVVKVPLHSVVDFPGWWLRRTLSSLLIHFSWFQGK
jgi:hypothetical protein